MFTILVLIEDCSSSDPLNIGSISAALSCLVYPPEQRLVIEPTLNINAPFPSLACASVSKQVLLQNLSCKNEIDVHENWTCRRNAFHYKCFCIKSLFGSLLGNGELQRLHFRRLLEVGGGGERGLLSRLAACNRAYVLQYISSRHETHGSTPLQECC